MGTLYAYRDHQPVLGAGTVLFKMAKGTGDVVIGEDTLIGDSHGPARIGSREPLDTHPRRTVLDGFPARAVDTLTEAPVRSGRALPPDAVDVIRRIDR